MTWVFLLESARGGRRHVAVGPDPVGALEEHNRGGIPETAPYAPWVLVGLFRFDDPAPADAFARWLREGELPCTETGDRMRA